MKSVSRESRGAELLRHDRRLGRRHGARFVAGADEAGRGCLAGPLVAAAVCLDLEGLDRGVARDLASLDDSKRLSKTVREELYGAVLAHAHAFSVQVVEPADIDRGGVHRANLDALARALAAVCPPAEVLLTDHYRLGEEAPPHTALTGGDAKSAAIAAAAIVAKVTRDRLMREHHEAYPAYGFDANVGYLTDHHRRAVLAHGPTPLHRMSFQARCYEEHARRVGLGPLAFAPQDPLGATLEEAASAEGLRDDLRLGQRL